MEEPPKERVGVHIVFLKDAKLQRRGGRGGQGGGDRYIIAETWIVTG